MHMGGKPGHLCSGHEPQVIVPMRGLRCPSRVHAVHLCRHLIGRPQPGLCRKRYAMGTVIGGEIFRIGQAVLFQRIPDTVIGTRFGKMVAAPLCRLFLVCNDPVKDGGGLVDHLRALHPLADHKDACSIGKNAGPFL